MRVFGSVARGDAQLPGDVDFLVEFAPDRGLLDHGGLLSDLDALLGVPVDVVSERGLRPRFRERMLREAQGRFFVSLDPLSRVLPCEVFC